MFEILTDKLNAVFKRLGDKGRLTEKDVDEALREVRLALLEADVNFRVARDFIDKVRVRALESQVLQSLSPGQQVVRIVHEELTSILGGANKGLSHGSKLPSVAMLVGLQGSGKTTTVAKLAMHLKQSGQRPVMVAADMRRPAAIEQLVTLGKQLDILVYHENVSSTPTKVAANGVRRAQELDAAWVLLDTGGRLHIDGELMAELQEIKNAVSPTEVLLVVDSMTGQDAVRVAQGFHETVGLTGIILTKVDGDARGGAALSITAVTGLPIKFMGTGEKSSALEPFHPDRLASRILGMGDVLSLIEKAQTTFDQQRAQEMERKMLKATFNLEDFLEQLQQMKRMGPVSQLLEMIPGFSSLKGRLPMEELDEAYLKKVEAIILSMTSQERHRPEIIDGSRRRRISRGSGTTPQDVNQLLNQFRQAQKMMKQVARGKLPKGFIKTLR